jgi:hypothetical protein
MVSFALESMLGRIIPAAAAEPIMKYLRFIRFLPRETIHRNSHRRRWLRRSTDAAPLTDL